MNGIAGERQVPAFLSVVGSKMCGLLQNLIAPDKPCTKPYGELVKILQDHLCPKPSIIAQRFRFHKRDLHDGESICDFVAELKRLSQHCDFGDNLNDTLRDRLVCGLTSEYSEAPVVGK